MKVITTNRLNRFWKNGVLPIKNALANKLNTANVVNNLLTTAAGYALDARQGKALDDKITALNGKTTNVENALKSGTGVKAELLKSATSADVIAFSWTGNHLVLRVNGTNIGQII